MKITLPTEMNGKSFEITKIEDKNLIRGNENGEISLQYAPHFI